MDHWKWWWDDFEVKRWNSLTSLVGFHSHCWPSPRFGNTLNSDYFMIITVTVTIIFTFICLPVCVFICLPQGDYLNTTNIYLNLYWLASLCLYLPTSLCLYFMLASLCLFVLASLYLYLLASLCSHLYSHPRCTQRSPGGCYSLYLGRSSWSGNCHKNHHYHQGGWRGLVGVDGGSGIVSG